MAVTVADVALDLRLIAAAAETVPAGQSAILARHLAAAESLIDERTTGAPDSLRDAAIIAIAAYAYDKPTATAGIRFANSWRNSGASEILAAYVRRQIGVVGDGPGVPQVGGVGGLPVGGLAEAAVKKLIADALAASGTDTAAVQKLIADALAAAAAAAATAAALIPTPGPIALLAASALAASATAQAVTITEAITTGFMLEFRFDSQPDGVGYLTSNVLLAQTTRHGNAPGSTEEGGIGIKIQEPGNGAFGHGSILVWRHDDDDKLWLLDGRGLARRVIITAYPMGGARGAVGPASTVPGPRGLPGAASVVPGPRGAPGAASFVPGPRGAPGAASVVPGPRGAPGAGGLAEAEVNALIRAALAAASIPVVGDYIRRSAISTDNALSQAEFGAGSPFTAQAITMPTWSGGRRFLFIGVPEAEGDIIMVTSGGIEIFQAFERVTGASYGYKWWRTINSQSDVASGVVYKISEA